MKTASIAVASWMIVLAGGLAAQNQNPAQGAAGNAQQSDSANITNTAPEPALPSQPAATPPKESDGAGPGDSHVRIVRMSQVQGHIGLDRGTGEVERTMQNMPIVEGSRLATGEDGYAEVEFEDGSTLLLAPDSQVNFPQLILRSTGAKATTITLMKGTAYINLEKTKGNEFSVKTGDSVMTVAPGTHLRLEQEQKKVVLAVFNGGVEVKAGQGSATVTKKHTAIFETTAANAGKIDVQKDIEESDYDEWDKNALDYHRRYSKASAYGSSLYSYGISDLNYYGGFVNAGGCGSMWRPYFVGAGWDPYGNGVWAWYQGAGYSWVSPYPWGWLPYHSGAWSFCPGVGWGWRPGSTWMGLANGNPGLHPAPVKPGMPGQGVARGGMPVRPIGPEHPTAVPHSTLVLANRTPLVHSKIDRPGNFVFQKDSAGLGVPRLMGNLHGVSNHVEHNGFVNRQIYSQPEMSQRIAERGAVTGVVRSGAVNSTAHENHFWSFRGDNHQPGMNGQSFHRGPDGQAGGFHGDRGGNAAAGAFHQGGGAGGSHGSNTGAMSSGGSYHGGSGGGMNSGGGGFHGGSGGGGGGFHGGGGSMGGGAGASSGGGGGFHGGGGGGGSSPSSSGGGTHR
jgi:ferric-dicitrate binding protein FerR (iron transport regulator)